MDYEAIIVGGGIGGCTCGSLLQEEGYDVLIIEKNDHIGGKAMSIEKKGHRVDMFSHMINGGGKINKVLEKSGGETLDFKRKDPPLTLTDGETSFGFSWSSATDDFLGWLGLEGEDLENSRKVMRSMLNAGQEEIEEALPLTLEEYLDKYDAPALLSKHVNILSLLGLVVPSKYGSAGEFMACLRNALDSPPSICYPVGGIGEVGEVFMNSFKDSGGELVKNRVEDITVKNGKAVGVETSEGEVYSSEVVISNCGIQPTVLKLVGEKHFSEDYIEKVKSLYPSLGAIRIHYYLDEKLTSEGAMLWIPKEPSFDKQMKRVKEGKLPQMGAFVTVPSNFDPSLSPPGKQAIVAISAAPPYPSFDKNAAKDWFKVLNRTVRKMIPGIEKHSEHMDYAACDTIARISGRKGVMENVGGECIGISQSPSQVGDNKPDPQSPLDGLFFVGADAGGSGVGVVQAADSGENVFKIVADYLEAE